MSITSRRYPACTAAVLACAIMLFASPAAAQQGNGKGSNPPPPSSTCPAGQVCAMVITPGDSIAPTVTIKPAVDSVHVLPLAAEVDFGDNVGLDRTKLSITLNGTRIDGSMTTTGSGASYVSKGNLTLVAGANTLTATICDTSGLCTTSSWVWNYRPYVSSVAVTPDGSWSEIPAGTAWQPSLTVKNTGETTATFTLSATCTGAVFATGCGVSPSSVTLAAGAQQAASATFTSGNAGTTGTLRVTATLSGNAAVKDDGWMDFETSRTSGSSSTPFAAIANPNPGTSVERSLCLTMAAGPGAYECGDLRLVQALPPVRTLNKARAPVLIYNSGHAHPYPIVAAIVDRPSTMAAGDSLVLILRVNGVQRARSAWNASGQAVSQAYRLAVGYDALSDTTGLYPYTLEVTRWGGGAMLKDTTLAGQLVVVNRANSPYRPGWWVAGVEQLVFEPGNARLWIGGDGSTRLFNPAGTNAWTAEKVDGIDSLSYDPATATYTRWPGGGVRVVFDGSGRHVQTISRTGQVTQFAYSGTRLTSITVPVRSGTAPAFQFSYDAGSLLSGVDAPSVGGQARHVGLQWLGSAGAYSLVMTEPDQSSVSFAYGSDNRRITQRTDRVGGVVEWSYDAGLRLAQTRIHMKGAAQDTADLVSAYTPQESRGLTTTTGTDIASGAFTVVDGPRGDVADVTIFRIARFGGPDLVYDALQRWTVVWFNDPNFPALATRMESPNGSYSRATYDARGNVTTVVQENPWGDGRSTVTRYAYGDARWPDFATRVVNPAGDSTVSAYDASGNRVWQQDGRGDSTRVSFTFDAYGAVTSIRSARAAAHGENATVLAYDGASGNLVSTTSPLGFVSHVRQDEIGRDTASDSPIDGFDVARTHVWLNVMGEDTLNVAYGDTMEGDRYVKTTYDREGRTTSVEHWATRGGVAHVKRLWQFDAAGRAYSQTAEDHGVTTVTFDHAGNAIKSANPRDTTFATYDVLNRVTKHWTSQGTGYGPFQTTLHVSYTNQSFGTRTWPYPGFADSDGAFRIPADTATFAYDSLTGGMTQADNRDAQVRRTYFPNGQIATETQKIRTWTVTGAASDFDSHVYTLTYAYDLDGRRASLRHPSGIAPRNGTTGQLYDLETYGYEPGSGALASVTGVLGTQYRFFYDADMRTDSVAYPGGRFSTMTYDGDGRLVDRRDSMPNWTNGFGHQLIVHRDYDQRGKVLEADDDKSHMFTYSILGSVTSVEGIGGHYFRPSDVQNETYTTDALGRRVQEQRWGTAAPTITEYDQWGRFRDARPAANVSYQSTPPLQQNASYDPAGNQEWFYQENFPLITVDGTRSFYGPDEKLRATDREVCYTYVKTTDPPVYDCTDGSQLNNASASVFEWYRYDALGRRVLVRTRRDHECPYTNPSCASTITRYVWDGDQILYEIRAPGGNVVNSVLEDDNQQGNPYYGRVAYTHGGGIDQPLEIIRMGWTPNYDGSYGLSTLNGPYSVIPFDDWHAMAGATTWTGRRVPCAGTPDLCSTGIWPASSQSAFWDLRDPVDQQAWFGSLTSGQSDGSNFMYMRNRYYNPQTGTFTQPDPIGIAGGLNVYGFAVGDPVSYSDPFGLCPPWSVGEQDCSETYYRTIAYAQDRLNAHSRAAKIGYGIAQFAMAFVGVAEDFPRYLVAPSNSRVHANVVPIGFGAVGALSDAESVEAAASNLRAAEPVGSALKSDPEHIAAAFLRDEAAANGVHFRIRGGDGVLRTLTQLPAEVNGRMGRVEYIVEDQGNLTHARFVRGGTINGRPNTP